MDPQSVATIDVVTTDPIGHSLQEPREIAVQPQHLIVNFPRVGTERMADCVGGGKTDRQDVGAFPAESQCLEPFQHKQ